MPTRDPQKIHAHRQKYDKSAKGKAARARYNVSAAGRERTKRYRQSAKGKAWKTRQNHRRAWLDGKRCVLMPTHEAATAVKALTSEFRARQGAAYRAFVTENSL